MSENVMTLEEVSEYLRVHPSTIYRLLKKHLIPAFKVGSDWRFNRTSIEQWCSRLEDDRGANESEIEGLSMDDN